MANRFPVVRKDGQNVQIPTGDSLQLRGELFFPAQPAINAASTTLLSSALSTYVQVDGTATITSFGPGMAGNFKIVVFTLAGTILKHDATYLRLPTGADITVRAGDSLLVSCTGITDQWRVRFYQRADGTALVSSGSGSSPASTDALPEGTTNLYFTGARTLASVLTGFTPSKGTVTAADSVLAALQKLQGSKLDLSGGTLTGALNEAPPVTIASSATVNIGAAAANTINITGTTAITAFDTIAAGAKRTLVFAGALTLTYNATSMQLLTGASITTAAGDIAEFESLGSGNWKMIDYARANGLPLASLVTSVAARTGDVVLAKADVGLSNVDNTADTAKPVSTAQAAAIALHATDISYISGLVMVWQNATGLSLTSGSAYIQGVGKNITTGSISVSSLSLTTSTWYHLYLYLNGANPAIEVSTTNPDAAYLSSARNKTGDNTRRYVGSIFSNSSGSIQKFYASENRVRIATFDSSQNRLLAAGSATSSTSLSTSNFAPVTATKLYVKLNNYLTGPAMLLQLGPTATDYQQVILQGSSGVSILQYVDVDIVANQIYYSYNTTPASGGGGYVDSFGYEFGR